MNAIVAWSKNRTSQIESDNVNTVIELLVKTGDDKWLTGANRHGITDEVAFVSND